MVLIAGFLAVATAVPVEASVIQQTSTPLTAMNSVSDWPEFLAGGPTLWAEVAAPPIDQSVKNTIAADLDQAAANPGHIHAQALSMVQYVIWRRSLDPSRFDSNHPQYVSDLERIITSSLPTPPTVTTPSTPPPPTNPTTTPPTIPPTTPSTPTITTTQVPPSIPPEEQTIPPGTIPPAIPEPSALIMTPVLLAAGALWRRRRPQAGACRATGETS
jgi:hypothetical protein